MLESNAARVPFYTAAGVFSEPGAGPDEWGSDIAAVDDPCGGATPVVIAASASSEREEVRAYGAANGQPSPASDALPLPGPVTALWPAESRGQATLVIRNQQTGAYEVSRLGLACPQ